MAKFIKKPLQIEAFQLTYEVAKGIHPIPIWAKEAHEEKTLQIHYTDKIHNSQYAFIETLEGTMEASANDWIIKGIKGEIYPCKPEIFEKTYDLIEE